VGLDGPPADSHGRRDLGLGEVLTAAGLAVRIRAEERQLIQALGAEYARFAAGRKRLVPGCGAAGRAVTGRRPAGWGRA
jgi:hypothetical protein